jgi:small subunit ribosomal protein S2
MNFYLENFLNNSVHIGHNFINSLLLSSWFFYKLNKKIWIINIFKTIIFLKITFKFLTYLVNYKLPFWFINLEKTKELVFKKFANFSGEFFCSKIWIRGLLSNFKSIQKTLSKYFLNKYLITKEKKNILVKNWIATRYSWPRSIFLSNILYNYIVCKEAGSILLPIVAMVDTNIKSYLFHFPIPSNDDSIYSISFITSLISNKLLLVKYKKLILWYSYYKNNKYKNIIKLFEAIQKLKFVKLVYKKFFKFSIINSLFKFRNNIKFLFKLKILGAKNNYDFLNRYLYYNRWLNRSLCFFKNLSNYYIFYKKTFLKFRYKYSKNYLVQMKNFIKFFNLKNLNKNKSFILNKKRKKLFKKYLSLNFYFLKKNFSFTNNIYDIYFSRKFVDLAFLLNIYRWVSLYKRLKIKKYIKRNLLHYWLFPSILRFCIKKNKKKWFHSKFFRSLEKSSFSMYLNFFNKKKQYLIEPTLLKFYNDWFYFLFTR